MTLLRFLSGLALSIAGSSLAGAQELAQPVPYCSVAVATASGKSRTMWDVGEVDDTCEAAQLWLGEEPDWRAKGEFDPTASNKVELRCYLDGRVYLKTFTGTGAEPFEAASSHPANDEASCLVIQVGDDYATLRFIPPPRPRAFHQLSYEDELIFRELGKILNTAGADREAFELPSFTVDREAGEITLFVPPPPATVETKAMREARERELRTGFLDDDTVHEEVYAADDGGARSGSNIPDVSSIGPSGSDPAFDRSSPRSGDAASAEVKHREEKILFGAKASVGGSIFTDVNFHKNGVGSATADARFYILRGRESIVKAQLTTSRIGVETPTTQDDKLKIKAYTFTKVTNKTLLLDETVELDHRKETGPQKLTDVTLFKRQWVIMVGPVPVVITISVRGEVGLAADYVGIATAPDDISEVLVHAGVQPYTAAFAVGRAALATDLVEEEFRAVDVSYEIEIEMVRATFLASADWSSKGTGPCAEVKMLRPNSGAVKMALEAKLDLFGKAPEEIVNMVGDMCDMGGGERSVAGATSSGLGLRDGFGGDRLGGALGDLMEGKPPFQGGPPSLDVNGVLGQLGDADISDIDPGNLLAVIDSGQLEALRDKFLDTCKDLEDMAIEAGRLTKMKYRKEVQPRKATPWGRDVSFFSNDSCRHVPPATTLEICNKHPSSPIDVALVRFEGGSNGWVAAGWESVPASSCRIIANFGTYEGPVYYYAMTSDRQLEWSGGDASFCINRGTGFQHPEADRMSCSGAGLARQSFKRVELKQGANRHSLSVNLPTVKFCNDTSYERIFAAIGYLREGAEASTGWFTIPRGECKQVLRLASGPIYGFATNDTSAFFETWGPSPSRPFCVRSSVFEDLIGSSGSCPDGSAKLFHRISGNTWRIREAQ
jgi:uncharacterized membrane protein